MILIFSCMFHFLHAVALTNAIIFPVVQLNPKHFFEKKNSFYVDASTCYFLLTTRAGIKWDPCVQYYSLLWMCAQKLSTALLKKGSPSSSTGLSTITYANIWPGFYCLFSGWVPVCRSLFQCSILYKNADSSYHILLMMSQSLFIIYI